MRQLILTTLIVAGLARSALGQGWFDLDSSGLMNGVDAYTPGNPYAGVFGMEVWELNGTNQDLVDNINFGLDAAGSYQLLAVNGFRLERTYSARTMTDGITALGTCPMPDVSPAGSVVTVALVVWNTSAATFAASLLGDGIFGVIAFLQPTTDYTSLHPKSPPPLAWAANQDLLLDNLEPQPFIARQPKDTTAVLGGTATFTVTVASDYPFDYQWRFNGNEIPPAAYTTLVSTNAKFPQWTTNSLILTDAQWTNAGQYSFSFASTSGFWGSWVSSNATLSITFPPPSLSMVTANPGVTLSWPIWATNYVLQEATVLAAPSTTWSNVALSPVVGASDMHVTLQPDANRTFYRLRNL